MRTKSFFFYVLENKVNLTIFPIAQDFLIPELEDFSKPNNEMINMSYPKTYNSNILTSHRGVNGRNTIKLGEKNTDKFQLELQLSISKKFRYS